MSVRIKTETCIGCGRCTEVCPGNLLKLKEKKAELKHPEDCWGCTSCIKECPVDAFEYFLQPDVGGRGTTLSAKKTRIGFDWTFKMPDGRVKTITIDSSNSNNY